MTASVARPHLRLVTDPAGAPRELEHRAWHVEPDQRRQPYAHVEWCVERLLGAAWDEGRSPYLLLDAYPGCGPEGRVAVDRLFDAARDVADAQAGRPGSYPLQGVLDDHADALYTLAKLLRGAE